MYKIQKCLDLIDVISRVRDDYVISGSAATMIYLGKEIREIGDIDVHFESELTKEDIKVLSEYKKINSYNKNEIVFEDGLKMDISYEKFPYEIHNGIKLVKLEKLVNDKINRGRAKDIYDLYFFFGLDEIKTMRKIYRINKL